MQGPAEIRRAALEEAAAIVDESAVEFERQAKEATDGQVHDAMLMASDALELTASAIRQRLLVTPAPLPQMVVGDDLLQAVKGIDDDYMTSEKHHPGYVLIPTAKFEAIRAALTKISSLTQSTGLLWWQIEARAALGTATEGSGE